MGFAAELAEVARLRERGAPEAEVIDAFRPEVLQRLGYFGPPDGAADAFQRHAQGADIGIVRIIPARPGIESMLAVMEACQPAMAAA
jgi:hypothetical protein